MRNELREQIVLIEDQYVVFKSKFYGKSSEREPVEQKTPTGSTKKVKVLQPSKRCPNVPLIERDIELQELPQCDCCS